MEFQRQDPDLMQVEQPITKLRITNKNDFTIKDGYNSVTFVFKGAQVVDGKTVYSHVDVLPEVAAHIFGFKPYPEAGDDPDALYEAMLRYCSMRHGWNSTKNQDAKLDRQYFDNIVIEPVRYELKVIKQKEA
jgi:hypothetical protein